MNQPEDAIDRQVRAVAVALGTSDRAPMQLGGALTEGIVSATSVRTGGRNAFPARRSQGTN